MAYQRWWKTVRDQQGNAINGATCTIYNGGMGTLATVYDPNSDDATPAILANPFITTSNGVFGFMAADGEYDVQISGGSLATQQYRVTLTAEAGPNAVSKSDLASTSSGKGASLIGDKGDFTGEVDRTQHEINNNCFYLTRWATGDGSTDDSAKVQAAIDAVGASGGGIIDGSGKTYIMNTTGAVVNYDNVFLRNFTFKRTSTVTGWLLRFATTANTTGGGVINGRFVGLPTVAGGMAGLGFGVATNYSANEVVCENVTADSFSQYGVGFAYASGFRASNIRVINHGLTTGVIGSCIGFYVFPNTASSGGMVRGVYSEISAACQANTSANAAAVKLQCHKGLIASDIHGIGGSEECISIDSVSGRISNIIAEVQGNNTGVAVGNCNPAHSFSGQTFEIDGLTITGGTSGYNLTMSGDPAKSITSIDTGTDTITITSHGWAVGMPVTYLNAGGTWAGGLVDNELYYLINVTTNTFQLSRTLGGSAIDITGAGTGTQKIEPVKLAGCSIKNVKAGRCQFLNYGGFKNCVFENWKVEELIYDQASAGGLATEFKNTGNRLVNVQSVGNSAPYRFIVNIDGSQADNCGNFFYPGKISWGFPQFKGSGNKVTNTTGKLVAIYNDPASIIDGSGASITLSTNSISGIALGDFYLAACSVPLLDQLLTVHPNTATQLIWRLQNESGGPVDLDYSRFAARRIYSDEIKRFATKVSWNPSGVNIADGAGLSTTVTVPGAALGDVAVGGWKSGLSAVMPFCYVSAADTVTFRIQNESGGSSNVSTATADLNVAILREDKADFVGAVTYDPPSLADAAGTTTTLTVPGASIGDFVAVSFSLDLQGILVCGWVSAADTVSVRFQNETGGPLDLAPGILKVLVYSGS